MIAKRYGSIAAYQAPNEEAIVKIIQILIKGYN